MVSDMHGGYIEAPKSIWYRNTLRRMGFGLHLLGQGYSRSQQLADDEMLRRVATVVAVAEQPVQGIVQVVAGVRAS